MTQTIQSYTQTIVVKNNKAVFPFSMPEKIDEKTRGEYVKLLDDLCAVLEKYSTALARSKSEITDHRNRIDKLQFNKVNVI